MIRRLRKVSFIKNVSGATAIEYGMIAAGIALTILASVYLLGDTYKSTYTYLINLFDSI